MPIQPSLLYSLTWFAHIARHRSFTKAAAEMEVTRAALSQHLKALEQSLDVRLLNRTTRDMSLTEEGQRLLDVLVPALGAIDGAVRQLRETRADPTGLIRLNTSRVAAKTLIEPHLGEFLARHPKLKLELIMDDGLSNIIADGCDAGIRIGESLSDQVVAVPITPMLEMAVVASPAYVERHGMPESPQDLVQHDCVRYRMTTAGGLLPWEFSAPGKDSHLFYVEPQGSLITNDDEAMIRAALQGTGLVQHLDIAVRAYLDNGSLVRLLQPWSKPFAGFYLYMPSRDHMPAKMRALVDFFVEKRELMTSSSASKAKAASGKARNSKPADALGGDT